MKKIIFILLIIHFSLLIVNAQWQSDVRLTNDTAGSLTSYNNARCIAANVDSVHVVWYDFRDGNYEIFYKRSMDGGVSWGADTQLTNNSSVSQRPSVSLSGQIVHVVWQDNRDGNLEIYYKRSIDGGVSWEADTRLTSNSAESNWTSISVSGQVVHVVWYDERDVNSEIYYKRSTDGGTSWGPDTRLTNDIYWQGAPSVSVSDLIVHVVWHELRDGNWEIYYKRSTDGGISWRADTRLTNNSAFSAYTCVSASGQLVHAVWQENRDGNYEIYYKHSTDAGTSWGTDTRLTNNPANSELPSVSVSDLTVHVVWQDFRNGNREIYYKRSTNEGTSWESDIRLTNNAFSSEFPSVSVSGLPPGRVVHVLWQDYRDGNWEIYYKRDTAVNVVGIKNINSELPNEFSLSQNYPNPFNPTTNVEFQIPRLRNGQANEGFVKLIVFDVLGREAAALVNEQLKPGTYEVDWNASNYPSGVYYYKLTSGEFTETKKMILIK